MRPTGSRREGIAPVADVVEVLDLLDLALARSEGIVPAGRHEELVEMARRIRIRDGFVGEVLVAALAGGTGSGKSSILNALADEELVPTGIVRPTTQHATAVYPPGTGADLTPLLDTLGVEARIADATFEDIVIVDLPDFDSTAEAHRHVVESVLPTVDVVVWVLDPEKYADPVLHDEFLSRLADYESQFVFALNQADRLGGDAQAVADDLRQKLVADGFASAAPVVVAADPADAEADVEAIRSVLADRLDTKQAAVAKLGVDARRIAASGHDACLTVDRHAIRDDERYAIALAAATFVSLGVAAYEVYRRAADRMSG